jgi:hypothetical protein
MCRLRRDCVFSLVIALTFAFVGESSAQAQRANSQAAGDPHPQAVGRGGGFFAIGVHATDLSPLNGRLRRAGYPTFSRELLSLGGGGYGRVAGSLIVGGEGYGLIAPSQGHQGREVSVGGGYGLFTVGYQFRPTSGLRVHPLLGIGGGGFEVNIGSASGGQFDDVLEDPGRGASLETGSVLLSVGGGLEYRFRHSGDGGVQVGLRAGYLLSPYEADWRVNGSRLSNAPGAPLQGPFVRVLLGGWGRAQ